MPEPHEAFHPQTLLDVLQFRALRHPDDEAYTFLINGETQEESLTYGELYERACAIGAQLQTLGGVGERALILCPAGLDYVAAFFGCVCSGWVAVLAYAPNPTEEHARLRSIIGSSQPRVGITTSAALPAIKQTFAHAPQLAELNWLLADSMSIGERETVAPPRQAREQALATTEIPGSSHCRLPMIGPESLVYLIYTSGSTAAPKGVAKTNRDLLVGLSAGIRDEPRTRGRVVNWAPPHTGSVIVGPMLSGDAATHMAPDTFLERPARWIEAISRTRATYSMAPNFAYDLVVDAIPPEERARLDLSHWQYAFNAGEQVRAETIVRFEDAFAVSGLRRGTLLSAYGLSEAVGISTARSGMRPTMVTFDRRQLEAGNVVPLLNDREDNSAALPDRRMLVGQGKPDPTIELLIVDPETLERCGPDRVGEVWTAGRHVAAGYWNAPEETEAAFRAHLSDTGAGPYVRTGDLGFLYDGELFISGRLKELIIIGGRNVHAVDVEGEAQRSHPAVETRAGAAFAIEARNTEQLVIVQEIDTNCDEAGLAEIVAAIRRTVTSRIGIGVGAVALVPVGAIPRTDIGKLRRAACRSAYLDGTLPVLFSSAEPRVGGMRNGGRRTPYAPPTTQVERTIVNIWESVLGTRPIGIHDEFIDLGGDSLRSLQVLARMRANGIHVGLSALQYTDTVSTLVNSVRVRQSDTGAPAEAMPVEGPVVGPVPMLPRQYSVVGNRETLPGNLVTVIPLEATEPLDATLLETAARALIFHHDVLRMRFHFGPHGWEAECLAHTPARILSVHHLSGLSEEESMARMREDGARLHRQIDIRRGVMLQIGLFHHGNGQPDRVLFVLPHLVYDAYSLPILLEDLETAHRQLKNGSEVQLPARTTSIRRWGERLRELAASDAMRDEVAYWLEVLRDGPSSLRPDLGLDGTPGGIAEVRTIVDRETTLRLLREAPRRHEFRIVDALVDAVARAVVAASSPSAAMETNGGTPHLRATPAKGSVTLDIWSHGREPIAPDIDLSRTVGYFTTQFPVRVELDPNLSPLQSAAQVRAQLRAVPRGGIGFDVLRYLCQDQLCAGLRAPDAPIRLNYQGETGGASRAGSLFVGITRPRLPEGALPPNPSTTWPAGVATPPTTFLDIAAFVNGEHLKYRVSYHTQVYRHATIERFAARIREHLELLASLL